MNTGYRTVNHCLQELHDLELPQIKKLPIEIELLQAKRLLLLSAGVATVQAVDFEAFRAAFAAVCISSEKWSAEKLMALVKDLHAALRPVESFPTTTRNNE